MDPPSLVFEYVENTDFRRLYPTFRSDDVRYYMKELLKALEFCHGKSIMHRDIRPHNLMIDHSRRKVGYFFWPRFSPSPLLESGLILIWY